ncbi:hypothetical protein [Synechococcus phage Yong-M4-211]|nr:hypothetical protein [Synechococcus phage Yong-M4-211]
MGEAEVGNARLFYFQPGSRMAVAGSANLPALLRRVVFVSKPPLRLRLDDQGVGLGAVDSGNHIVVGLLGTRHAGGALRGVIGDRGHVLGFEHFCGSRGGCQLIRSPTDKRRERTDCVNLCDRVHQAAAWVGRTNSHAGMPVTRSRVAASCGEGFDWQRRMRLICTRLTPTFSANVWSVSDAASIQDARGFMAGYVR